MRFRQRILTGIISAVLMVSSCVTVGAETESKLKLYFAPQIMDDQTGELVVDVDIRNYDIAVPKSLGAICAVTFSFEYDKNKFYIKTKDDAPMVMTGEDSLVKSAGDIESSIDMEKGRISFTFIDSTLKDNLITKDGRLFSFVMTAKNPREVWNSTEKSALRFVPASLGLAALNVETKQVIRIYDVEGIDIKVGGYNIPPTLLPNSIDKKISFSEGETKIYVDGEEKLTDAASFKNKNEFMIPVRYIAESIGMSVEWDGDVLTASAYGEYKTLKIRLKGDMESGEITGDVFINSSRAETNIKPTEKDGRIYIPVSVIKELYSNAKITETENSVEIYIP